MYVPLLWTSKRFPKIDKPLVVYIFYCMALFHSQTRRHMIKLVATPAVHFCFFIYSKIYLLHRRAMEGRACICADLIEPTLLLKLQDHFYCCFTRNIHFGTDALKHVSVFFFINIVRENIANCGESSRISVNSWPIRAAFGIFLTDS